MAKMDKIKFLSNVSVAGQLNIAAKEPSKGLVYDLSEDGTYAICTGTGTCRDTEIIVAATYKGKPVKEIGQAAFSEEGNNFSHAVTIVLPEGLEVIDSRAFYMCDLQFINLPSSLKFIGDNAFHECVSLKSIEIPKSVREIQSCAFYSWLEEGLCPIVCEADSLPFGWAEDWNGSSREVIWGAELATCNAGSKIEGFNGQLNNIDMMLQTCSGIELALERIIAIQEELIGNEDDTIPESVGLEYSEDGAYVLGRGTCTDRIIKIPSDVGITYINQQAFENDQMLDALILPDDCSVGLGMDAVYGSSVKIIKNIKDCESFALGGATQLELVTFGNITDYVSGVCELRVDENCDGVVFDFTRNTTVPEVHEESDIQLGFNHTILVPLELYNAWVYSGGWEYYGPDRLEPFNITTKELENGGIGYITFVVENHTFIAKSGTTWGEWSSVNLNGDIAVYEDDYMGRWGTYMKDSITYVKATDVIKPNKYYYFDYK